MKKIVAPALMALAAGLCSAQEMGRVVSSTPVIQQVAVPRQVCTNQQVISPGNKSGAGAAMGAIAGGAIGNAVGDGSGRAIATVIGLVGGAILGDKVEGPGQPQTQNVQTCSNQTFYENRTVYYNVVYEYAGKQYTVQMPNDPGPYVKLQITPISQTQPQDMAVQTYAAAPAVLPMVQVQAPAQWVSQPVIAVSDAYYPRSTYPRHHHSRGGLPAAGISMEWQIINGRRY